MMGLSLRKRRQAQGRRREACDIPRRHQRRVQEAPQRVGWRSTTTTTDHSSPAEATCATSSRGSMSKAQTWQVLVAEAPTAEVSVAQASLALKYVESAAATGGCGERDTVCPQPAVGVVGAARADVPPVPPGRPARSAACTTWPSGPRPVVASRTRRHHHHHLAREQTRAPARAMQHLRWERARALLVSPPGLTKPVRAFPFPPRGRPQCRAVAPLFRYDYMPVSGQIARTPGAALVGMHRHLSAKRRMEGLAQDQTGAMKDAR